MQIIKSSEMYTQILKKYKSEKKHCGTNMLLMQNEISDLIDDGRLYYDVIEGVLWFFDKNDDFYIAYFYLPKGEKLKMVPQDCDVLVELIGNTVKYDSQRETELLETGFEKYRRNIESLIKKEERQSEVERLAKNIYSYVENIGCYRRSAEKTDYKAMHQMWRSRIDKYAVHTLTKSKLDEMVKYQRGRLIFNEENELCCAVYCSTEGNTGTAEYAAASYKGLGAVACYEGVISLFNEGCERVVVWIWENNKDSLKLWKHIASETGKFCQQFLMKKAN